MLYFRYTLCVGRFQVTLKMVVKMLSKRILEIGVSGGHRFKTRGFILSKQNGRLNVNITQFIISPLMLYVVML